MAVRKQRDERHREKARASGSIGRARELEQLESAFLDPATRVAFVCGPFGVGKTELLRAWAARAEANGVRAHWVDAREGTHAVDEALRALASTEANVSERTAIVIDHLDDPAAQARTAERLVSLAPAIFPIVTSHSPPSGAWSRLASAMDVVALRPIEPESSAYGARCEETVFEELAQRMLALARGETDVTALAVLSIARFTTLEILADAMPSRASAFDAYRWLATCCRFVERTPLGLCPDDVARRALSFHFARQHPATYARVQSAVKRYCYERLQQGVDMDRWLVDRIYLERHVPLLGEYVAAVEDAPPLTLGPLRDGEGVSVVAIAEAQLGADAARATREWLARGGASCDVVRQGGRVIGFSLCVEIPANAGLPIHDPVVDAAVAHCRAAGWLARPSPSALSVFRAWAVRDIGQRPSAAALHLVASQVARVLALRGAAFHAVVLRDPAPWLEMLHALGVERQSITCADGAIVVCDWRPRSLADALAEGSVAAIGSAAALHDATSSPDVVAEPSSADDVTPTAPSSVAVVAAEHEPDLGRMLQRRIDQIADEARLSRREREVLQLLFMGRNTEEIGIALGITARTAKFHQAGVLRKVGADSRLDLLRILL